MKQKVIVNSLIFLLLNTSYLCAQVVNYENIGQVWKTDTSIYSVMLSEFKALLKRDAIPPIDSPEFYIMEEALEEYFDHEPVLVVEINGKAKAYPLTILMYHEIVNDFLNGVPITVTYCPLCNATAVFDRRLIYKGKDYLLDFGVSGMLRKSDLVMWDRQTESWWQQFLGEALVGELTGAELTSIPSLLISKNDFSKTYQDGLILSKETGFSDLQKRYGTNPYENYDDIENMQPRLFFDEVDNRLPAMERVVDIQYEEINRIYQLSVIQKMGVINDKIKTENIVIFHKYGTNSVLDSSDIKKAEDLGAVTVFNSSLDGRVLTFKKVEDNFIDEQTSSVWTITGKCVEGELKGKSLKPEIHGHHFAFAWFAFHPETEIYEDELK